MSAISAGSCGRPNRARRTISLCLILLALAASGAIPARAADQGPPEITNPALLKTQLIANWDKYCKNHITETAEIKLEGDLKTYLDAFDFKIFKPLPVVTMI